MQVSLTKRSLLRSLSKAQKEEEVARMEVLSNMPARLYLGVVLEIKARTRRVRGKERIRSNQKLKGIVRRNKDCSKNIVCRWAKRERKHRRQQGQ